MAFKWSLFGLTNIILQFIWIFALIHKLIWSDEREDNSDALSFKICHSTANSHESCYELLIRFDVLRLFLAIISNAVISVLGEWFYSTYRFSFMELGYFRRVTHAFQHEIYGASGSGDLIGVATNISSLQFKFGVILCALHIVYYLWPKISPLLQKLEDAIIQLNRHNIGQISAFTLMNIVLQSALFIGLAFNLGIWASQSHEENEKTFLYYTTQISSTEITFNYTLTYYLVAIYCGMLSSIFLESCLDIIDKTTNACFIALTSWIVIILGLEYVAKNQFAFETNRLVDLQFGVNISMVFVYKVDALILQFLIRAIIFSQSLDQYVPDSQMDKLCKRQSKEEFYLTKKKV